MPNTPQPEKLLPAPTPPTEWDCCNSECGDACVHEVYRREKAAYDAQQRHLREQAAQSIKP